MCLAVPGKLLSVSGAGDVMRTGRVDFGGVVKEINLAFVPEANVGSYVLVHVGFAITVIDETEAARVFEHLRAIDELEAIESGLGGER
jgi:hydrogenase expression/formation protein HypC